jgi:hypothetical protein
METLSTTNSYLAAAFLVNGATLEGVDRDDPSHVRFLFSGSGLREIEHKWDNRLLIIDARQFADSIREIKRKIYKES